jgi:UDP-glucuronate decarboxylase
MSRCRLPKQGDPHRRLTISVRELALRIVSLTGSRSRIVSGPLPQDDPLRRCPDITRARRALGWEPGVMLDEGLHRTIGYFDRLLSRGA